MNIRNSPFGRLRVPSSSREKFEIRKFGPLLQLLRPPNLFTIPGDPLCGALFASHGVWSWRVLPAIVVSLASYCAGLVINDLADFKEDLRDRPGRPIPSGDVSRGAAVALGCFFVSVALVTAACVNATLSFRILTVLLIAEIICYNLFAKKNAFIAPIAMGLCRGSSVLVGAAAILQPPSTGSGPLASAFSLLSGHSAATPLQPFFLPASLIALYIAGVTVLARTETRNPRIPPLIGSLIRGLLFIQAGFCLLAGGSGWVAALLLLALWPASRLVASHFYAS